MPFPDVKCALLGGILPTIETLWEERSQLVMVVMSLFNIVVIVLLLALMFSSVFLLIVFLLVRRILSINQTWPHRKCQTIRYNGANQKVGLCSAYRR